MTREKFAKVARLAAFALIGVLTAARTAMAAPATQPVVECLSGDAARAALVDDRLEPYFATMTPAEMAAKVGHAIAGDTPAARLADCIAQYQKGVRDFTEDQRATLAWYVSKYAPPLVRDYPVFGHQPWSFVQTADTLEGGMPYTRGAHIILPEAVVKQLGQMRAGMPDRAAGAVASILVHEQTHVLQRLRPDLFAPLYTGPLGFVHARRIEPNDWLRQRQLQNPDGIVCDWILPLKGDNGPSYVLPLIAFDNPAAEDMRAGITTIAVTVEPVDGQPGAFRAKLGADGTPVVRPLPTVRAYTMAVGGGENFHPNEIAAVDFARLIAVDDFADPKQMARLTAAQKKRLESANEPIRAWAKRAFATP